ncbi:secA DEAD-like domain protein, partial [Orientia chuto str. Dubai]
MDTDDGMLSLDYSSNESSLQESINSQDLSLNEVIEEILNRNSGKIHDLATTLKNKFQRVEEAYNNDSVICPQGKNINSWSKNNITNWAKDVRESKLLTQDLLEEAIAVVKKANIHHCNNIPRITQILSILIFESLHNEGTLLQISTGEGKSTTCAMLAAIKALQGNKVDIVTTSEVLAQRDANEQEGFFRILDLSCGSNVEEPLNFGAKEKVCYSKDIVYGPIQEFQFDWLRHEHKKHGTRGNRKCEVVIVDEVDSMLIDELGQVARLARSMPGIEHVAPVLCGVANELSQLNKKIVKQGDEIIYINGEFKYEDGELILGKDSSKHYISDGYAFIIGVLKDLVKEMVTGDKLQIPDFLKSYISYKAEVIAYSALQAQSLKENENYIIAKKENGNLGIIPVDYTNTGVIRSNLYWDNYLHQFLQIKHGLKLTSESIVASFISNLGYFKHYGQKIYGMTGTIGSDSAQELIRSVYGVNIGFMPTYRPKQFEEICGDIQNYETTWCSRITSSIFDEVEKGRAVLVICETIKDAIEMRDRFISVTDYDSNKVRLYSRSDNDEYLAIKNEVNSGDVIVATNLAGRGTDIKTSKEVEKNGGLHVIVTFLPENLRVEEQAFGRTARQGAKGTAQLILSEPHVYQKLDVKSYSYNSIHEIKALRDYKEYIKMQETKLYEVERIKLQDLLFEEYLKIESKARDEIPVDQYQSKQWQIQQLEDRWGIELTKLWNLVYKNSIAQKGLQNITSKFGFIVPKEYVSGLNSLYKAVNIQLGKTITDEHLQLLTIGYFLDNEKRDDFDKLAQEFTDQVALRILSLINTTNIVLMRSDKEKPEVYRVKEAKGTIFIGLEASNEMYADEYKPLIKAFAATEDIKEYLNQELEEESTYVPENIFQRQDVMILLDSIIKLKAKEAKNCNKAKKEVALNFFGEFFERDIKKNTMRNPNYLVREAIISAHIANDYDKSLMLLDEACNMEPQYSLSAYYNKAYLVIKNHECSYKAEAAKCLSLAQEHTAQLRYCFTKEAVQNQLALAQAQLAKMRNFDQSDYKKEAINCLSLAQEQIDQVLIPNLEFMYLMMLGDQQTELLQQIINKIEMLRVMRDHIEQTKGKILDCKKNVDIKSLTQLEEVFSKNENLKDKNLKLEIGELIDAGIGWFFDVEDVQEKENRWFGTVFTFVAGMVQIGIGIACAVYFCNIELGAQLIVEGAKDLYKSIQIASGKLKFNMEEYISEKATTVAVFMTITGVQIALRRIAGTVAAKMLNSAVTKEAIGTARELLKETCIEVGKITTKALVNTGINYLIDQGAEKVIEGTFKNDFQEKVVNALKVCLDDATTSVLFKELLILDRLNYNTNNYKRILECISSLIQDNSNILREMINAGINTALSQSQHHIITIIGVATKFADSVHVWFEIDKIINDISKTLSHKIKSLHSTQNTNLISVYEIKLGQMLELMIPGLSVVARHVVNILQNSGALWSGNLSQASFNIQRAMVLNYGKCSGFNLEFYKQNYIIRALEELEQAINADYSGVKSALIENCNEYITNNILYKVRTEVFGHVTHATSQKLSNYVFDSLSKIKQELNKKKEERIRTAAVAQLIIKDTININDNIALFEKNHKDFINRVAAQILAAEASANDNFATPDSKLLATWAKNQEDLFNKLIAKILVADPSANDNFANNKQQLATWKGHEITVNKEEKWTLIGLYNIGQEYVVKRYCDKKAGIDIIAQNYVSSFGDRINQIPLELLLSPNIGAIFFEVSGQYFIYSTETLNQIIAQYFPKTRAAIGTAVSLAQDAVVLSAKAIWEQLPEVVKSTFKNPIIAIYEESKTVYQRLTKDLLEGQKALLNAALATIAVEVVAGVAIGTKAALNEANNIVKSTVSGNKIVPSTQKLLSVEKPLIPLIKEELSHSKLLSAAKEDGVTEAFIFKTDNKLVSLLNVESKDFGKTIANVNIPNEKICLADLNILKQQFGD